MVINLSTNFRYYRQLALNVRFRTVGLQAPAPEHVIQLLNPNQYMHQIPSSSIIMLANITAAAPLGVHPAPNMKKGISSC